MPGEFRLRRDASLAIIDWQAGDGRLNLLDLAAIESLETAVAAAIDAPEVVGIVIGSHGRDLGGGVDLSLFGAVRAAADPLATALALARRLHALFRRIETGGKPVAMATPGTAVGGVYELMLAGHRRFAAPRPEARIGLPEIRVGLFPGAGGTTRLVRMLGLVRAGEWLLPGRLASPQQALAAGLVDELAADPMAAAADWVRAAGSEAAVKPWDRPGFRLPGGGPYSRAGMNSFIGAATLAQTRSRGNYPAVEALVQAAYEGALVDFDAALEIEARQVARVIADPRCHAMIRTNFLSRTHLRSGARRPAPPAPLARLGVVGAGMMGSGIAYVAAAAGIRVVLLDRGDTEAQRGVGIVRRLAGAATKRGRLTPEAAAALLGRVSAGTDPGALAGAELVIEAVFEDPALKTEVLAAAGRAAPAAILASNTSTLPITGLAGAVARPENFLGIHFFSPVERMELVEVIRGPATGDRAVGRALDLVDAIGKTPILVRDAPFFYANRCIIPYTLEAAGMLAEGIPAARIEQAALAAGMPLGCLQLVDETSIELGVQILTASRAALGERYRAHPGEAVFRRMAVDERRLGRRAGAGFYDYEQGRRGQLWPGLARIWPPRAELPPVPELAERLLAIQAVEAVRSLADGVLEDVREGDVGAVLGWGFAPWSGGPFAWLDGMGAERAGAMLARLAERHGPRFAPPPLLAELAATGDSFYPRPATTEVATKGRPGGATG